MSLLEELKKRYEKLAAEANVLDERRKVLILGMNELLPAIWALEADAGKQPETQAERVEKAAIYGIQDKDWWRKNNPPAPSLRPGGAGPEGFEVWSVWKYNNEVPNRDLHGKEQRSFYPYPKTWGRGEWKAKTLEDCKQMALDYYEGVS